MNKLLTNILVMICVDLYVQIDFITIFFKGILELSKIKNFKQIDASIPILIISGEKDPVGYQAKGVKKLYQVLKKAIKHVDLRLYNEARHEILNELNRNEVYQDILSWIIMLENKYWK